MAASSVIITLFLLFALSRAFLRYKEQTISGPGVLGWTIFWVGLMIVVWRPGLSDQLAAFLGISRGTDAAIFIAILLIFYSLFRIYVQFEMKERELTRLIRALALKDKPALTRRTQ